MRNFAIILFILAVFVSCKKEEGIGGLATIKGKIFMKQYTGGILTYQDYAPDFDVFIIYGEENTYYDDKTTTSYDGSYEFRNLRPGMYKIFTYTKDRITGRLSPIIEVVEISGKKDVVEIPEITVED